ncbi:MAG: TIGR01777 family oxidoreductase [Blastocatellia bacterium]|nr:TIGR01777 family oxidoreductase [Blastocatellia bacterium]
MKILIAGATGLIGARVCLMLASEGHRIVALSRSPKKAIDLAADETHKWEPEAGPPPIESLKEVDAIIHLAGEPVVARRWGDAQKKRIRDSRVISTRNLVEGISSIEPRPSVFVCASAVGFYGDRGDERLDEGLPSGQGFLSDVCREWEAEAARAAEASIRTVQVRTGVVLSTEGGALKRMLPAFKSGIAGRLGDGRQWFPWIHLADIAGIFRHAILTPSLEGPVNGVAPGIVTNAGFTGELARALHRPAFLPVPAFALRLLMGEMADVLLASQRAMPKAALESGYSFEYPNLTPALENLLAEKKAG